MMTNRTGCSGLGCVASGPAPALPPSMEMDMSAPAELLICVKCRRGQEIPEDERRPGQRLYEEVTSAGPVDGLTVTPVECLQNCDSGCSVALRGGDRWTYVYGNFDETADAALLLQGAALYQATDDGLIPWRQRPLHFRKNCVARIPPLNGKAL